MMQGDHVRIIQDCHYKSGIQQKRTLFTSKFELNLMEKLLKCHIWIIALIGSKI